MLPNDNQLARYRLDVGFTQAEAAVRVARALGRESFHWKSLSNIEGGSAVPSAEVIRAIARVYKKDVSLITRVCRMTRRLYLARQKEARIA